MTRLSQLPSNTATALSLVLFIGCSAVSLQAQAWEDYDYEDLAFQGLGIEAGRTWPARVEPANFFGIRADLGFVGPNVRIQPTARFWSSTLDEQEVGRLAEQIIRVCERQPAAACPDDLDLGQVRLSDLELAVDAHYLFFSSRVASPYLGISGGVHLLNGSGDFIDSTFVEDLLDTVVPGAGMIAGLNTRIGASVSIMTEARFMLASDVRYVSLGVGGMWTIPTPRGIPNDLIARGKR